MNDEEPRWVACAEWAIFLLLFAFCVYTIVSVQHYQDEVLRAQMGMMP